MKICSANKGLIGSRALIAIPFLLFSYFSVAQSGYNKLIGIDRYVSEADSLSFRSQTSFRLTKFLKDDLSYLEHWHYSEERGRIVIFQISYIIDSIEFSEVYYVDRGKLVCSEEYEKINHSFFEDELRWGGIYYFNGSTPLKMVSLGKRTGGVRRQGMTGEDPAGEALDRFKKRYNELLKHVPMLPGKSIISP